MRKFTLRSLTQLIIPCLLSLCASAQNLTAEYPNLDIQILDSSGLSDDLITISTNDYFALGRTHSFLLDGFGNPLVHIWGGDESTAILKNRPLRINWWDEQEKWTILYLREDSIAMLESTDLELVEPVKITRSFDSRAIEYTANGKKIVLTLDYRNVFDLNNHVADDSIKCEWLSWHVEDIDGSVEVIDLAEQAYSNLDIYQYGYHITVGSVNDTTMDPIHSNSIDHFVYGDIEYFGSTNRTLSEVLIMEDSPNGRFFYHFGGPLNDFAIANDSIIASRAHDLNILEATDSTITVSFFNNGDGFTPGADYASGRVVKLNLNSLQAELVSETILSSTVNSQAMGSFDYETNTFAPGVFPDPNGLGGISPVLMVETDENGNPEMIIKKNATPSTLCFRAERFSPLHSVESILRPTLSINCDPQNNQLLIEGSKDGLYDQMIFIANGNELQTGITSATTAILPPEFLGEITVVSRLYNPEYKINIDKYSETITVGEDYCLNSSIQESAQSKPFAWLITGETLRVNHEGFVELFDSKGTKVLTSGERDINITYLSTGIYLVKSNNSSQQVFVP